MEANRRFGRFGDSLRNPETRRATNDYKNSSTGRRKNSARPLAWSIVMPCLPAGLVTAWFVSGECGKKLAGWPSWAVAGQTAIAVTGLGSPTGGSWATRLRDLQASGRARPGDAPASLRGRSLAGGLWPVVGRWSMVVGRWPVGRKSPALWSSVAPQVLDQSADLSTHPAGLPVEPLEWILGQVSQIESDV